eukprot:bmy_15194T0
MHYSSDVPCIFVGSADSQERAKNLAEAGEVRVWFALSIHQQKSEGLRPPADPGYPGPSPAPSPAPAPPPLLQSAFESEVSEISISQNEINLALRNLRAWMKDEKVPKNLATQLDSAFIRKEPFGLVLIIAPWNYPLNLSLEPLVGALAAGNCVLLKPSEISKSTEKVLAEVLPRYLDQSCFAVVLGGPQETGQLLEHKFDYIFFTGEVPVWGLCRMGEVRGLSPAPPLGVSSPTLREAARDRSR